MAMRLLHLADIHFGMENYGRLDAATGLNRRLLDFARSVHYAIDYALEHGVHLAIFAGDIYKHRDPDPSWQRAFAQCVRRLTDASVPVVILVGNHDIPNTVGKAHAVEIFATLGLPGVTVIGQPGLHFIETAVGRVQVVGLPYITRSFLLSREEYKDQPIADINRILVEKAEEILRQFATQIDPALPAILTVHGSVTNAVLSSEQSIMMVGHDPIIPLSALTNPAWDYVALGHIHRHQDLHQGAQPPVVYAGSVERIDFGEEREAKGFVWAQVDKGHTTYEFIPGPARRFITLRLDTQQGDPLQLLEQALTEHDIKDAVVRVILTVAPEHSDLVDERQIRERLREAYLLAGIVKEEIKAPVRSRDSGLTEVLGPLQAVERYIFSHPEYTDRRQALLERAQLLLQELQEELLGMIPLSLRLHNFMSYGEGTPPLDFSCFTTACLTGDNGHGKSTLLDAITWALWGETRAKSLDDVVRLGQDEAEVEFVFDLENERYRVLRKRSLKTRQSALELQGFDPATERYRPLSGASIRETEAKIVQLLHMNYDTFINSVFVLQGRADEFTTRRPGERKRILADILGLSVYDTLEARARAHRNEMDQDVKTLLQRLAELQQEVARKEELAVAVSAHQDGLAHLHVELQNAQQALEQLRQRQSTLELQSQRAQDVARRLQQVQQERLEVEQQLTAHQRRMVDYEAILQQESAILAGYQALQQLREQECVYSTQAEEYTTLQQRQTALQQALTTEQYRLELEQRSARQRQQELEQKIRMSETFLQNAPSIAAAYHALQEARQRDTAMAQTLQERYRLEQEKSQVEFRMQQKRHTLELEQRSLLDRQRDWQLQEATLPTFQRQAEDIQQHLAEIEQQTKRLEQIRTDGVAIRVQLETSLPQACETLQKEIHEQEEKRDLLASAGAHCPLCEKTLTEQERRRVIQKLMQEVARREARMQELQQEQHQLLRQRQTLRLEYRQVEQQVAQRQNLEQQYAVAQASLAEATRARDSLVSVLQALQELDTQLTAGTYATEELTRLRELSMALESLTYDREVHEAIQCTLVTLADAEVQQSRLQQVQAEFAVLRGQGQDIAQQLTTLEQILQSRQFAMAERLELQAVTERCERLGFSPAAHQALRQRIQEQQYVERQYMQLEAARTHLTEERTALHQLEARKQRVTTDLTMLEHEQRQYASELGALQGIRHEVARIEEHVRLLREREGTARVALGRSQSQYEHCLQQEIELQRKQQQRDQAVTERTLYGDLAQMFGKNGIQAIMIENAIPELEDEANRILARVTHNTMHLTLETQRDTRTGGVAETLDIKISDELGTRNYELFSSGEAFRINFAVRVSLAKMLARRAGARLRMLVIDEGFGTQDAEGLERLVEVIKAIQGDFAKIIVITHLRELKNAFETHIEVKKDPVRGSFYQIL